MVTPDDFLRMWHKGHGVPYVTRRNGVEYVGDEPRFQTLWQPDIFIGEDGTVTLVDWSESYRYTFDHITNDSPEESPEDQDRRATVLNGVLGIVDNAYPGAWPQRGDGPAIAAMFRSLADHIDPPGITQAHETATAIAHALAHVGTDLTPTDHAVIVAVLTGEDAS